MFELKKFQFVQFRGVFGLFLAKLFQMKLMRWRYQARIVFTKIGHQCTKINFTGKWPKIQSRTIWGLIIFCVNFVQFWKFGKKYYYRLKIIFILFFSLLLKASPGKIFFGPPPKKLLEKPFLGHFRLKIE